LFEDALALLAKQGHVHTVEAWRAGELVGGLYGIHLNGVFFAESMFSRPPDGRDASKVCLVHLAAHLKARGINLLDCQFLSDHLEGLGFVEVSRRAWRRQLKAALMQQVTWMDGA
jgi:leucyl/phenylalanyl-tRNA--protein transferase